MTAFTEAPAVAAPSAPIGLTFPRLLKSEWLKLWTLRSNILMVGLIVLAMLAIGPLICLANGHSGDGGAVSDYRDLTDFSLAGAALAELVVGVFGVLTVTNEYATGMIRASFTAAPHRLGVLAAKLVVFVAVFLTVSIVLCFIAFFMGQSISAHTPLVSVGANLGQPEVLRGVIMTGLYITLIGLLGMGLGWLVRNTAGAIATLFGMQLVLPVIVFAIPSQTVRNIGKAFPSPLPGESGFAMTHINFEGFDPYRWWVGALVVLAYVVGAMLLGALAVAKRDA